MRLIESWERRSLIVGGGRRDGGQGGRMGGAIRDVMDYDEGPKKELYDYGYDGLQRKGYEH